MKFENQKGQNPLNTKLSREFSGQARSRGLEYFLRDKVANILIGENFAASRIRGSKTYLTQLNWEGVEEWAEIEIGCSCPYFTGGDYCKHLWAFILELDQSGISKRIPLRGRIHLRMIDEDDLDDLPGDILEVYDSHSRSSQLTGALSKTEKVRDWRNAFKKTSLKLSKNLTSEELSIFIVLQPEPRSESSIKVKFYKMENDYSARPAYPLALSLPQNGQLKLNNPQLESAILAIHSVAQGEVNDTGRYFGYYMEPSSRTIRVQSLRFLLNNLLDTKKVYASTDDIIESFKSTFPTNLTQAHFGSVQLIVTDAESEYQISGSIEIKMNQPDFDSPGSISIPIKDLQLYAEPNLYRWKNYLGFLDMQAHEKSWFEDLALGNLRVPKEDSEAFLEALLSGPIKFQLPESLQWQKVQLKPEYKLHLTAEKQNFSSSSWDRNESTAVPSEPRRYIIDLKFQYGPRNISYSSPTRELASSEDKKIYMRDENVEIQVFSMLPLNLMMSRTVDNEEQTYIHSKNLFEFVKESLAKGIEVVVENKKVQESIDFQISVTSGLDWFDVDGQADFQGRFVKFPTILETIVKGEKFIPLADGSVGMITSEMTKRLEKLSNFSESTQDGLRFGRAQGLILNSLLEDEKNVNLDAEFRRLKDKIKTFNGIKACEAPKSFKGSLRKYQKEGLGWLEFLEEFGLGGILADDMGLGKTIQCLAFLEKRQNEKKTNDSPTLLLAPKSLLSNWQSEAANFTPEMKVHIHAGSERLIDQNFFKNYDLIVTTYQTMLRDIDHLKEMPWDCIILDEAQAIKNSGALISKASKILKAKFKLAMTGTPIENSLQDLFSISDFVNPGFLNGKNRSAHLNLSDDLKDTLSRAFKPVLLRRTKEQVLKDLPEKTEQYISVELESKQLKTYNELKRYYQSQLLSDIKVKGVNKSRFQILAALTRLRQAALHPGLIDSAHNKSKSAKFETVFEMLDEVISEGHRILIFSQFTSLLSLLKTELNHRKIKYCYLDGKTTKRQQVVGKFKSENFPVFLMSLKAGGVGLNLVEADYVFLLDPWWNPAVEAQAIDRVHRIGQKKAVNAYRFIAKGTVEEKILELQKTKKGLSDEIFGNKSNLIRNLTAVDIENLLS